MKKFLANNAYYFISTLFEDHPSIIENISPDEIWIEVEKTLSSLSKLNRSMILILLVFFSIILPPYGVFNIFYKAPLKKRTQWLKAWAESRFSLFRYAYVGIRILLYGSFSQIPFMLERTEYLNTTLKTREYKTTCFELLDAKNE